ncbi:SRPBCC family protein [Streptomyces sp. NPDC087440]|uniref:SRPBCC family protein n=1 Tax=Streptomyces sp. NPDC087440 TaxID=3365790 RepID=UPI0037F78CBC
MLLTHTVPVKATPPELFALVNDVQRVASCMPGAALDGRDGDAWRGRVTVKVGPITAAYFGSVRFLDVDADRLTLRVQARGTDTHGTGDAEAEVSLEVAEAAEGAVLRLTTDLVIRGKIAQFGKGAIGTVSERILHQFAQNLGSLLDAERAGPGAAATPGPGPASPTVTAPGVTAAAAPFTPAATPVASSSAPAAASELDGLALIAGPALAKAGRYTPLAAAFAFGVFEGWLLGRLASRERRCAR